MIFSIVMHSHTLYKYNTKKVDPANSTLASHDIKIFLLCGTTFKLFSVNRLYTGNPLSSKGVLSFILLFVKSLEQRPSESRQLFTYCPTSLEIC